MAKVYVGVLHVELHVPGARSRKDRRQVVRSVADRVRHRFDVSFHELDDPERAARQSVVITTAGNDGRLLRSILDQIRAFMESQGSFWLARVDVDVFRWHPAERVWSDEGWGGLLEEDLDD